MSGVAVSLEGFKAVDVRIAHKRFVEILIVLRKIRSV